MYIFYNHPSYKDSFRTLRRKQIVSLQLSVVECCLGKKFYICFNDHMEPIKTLHGKIQRF